MYIFNQILDQHSHQKKKSILFFLSILFLYLSTRSLWALQSPSQLSNASGEIDCSQFCTQFANPTDPNSKTPGGLVSSTTWSDTDDALCYALGKPTTSSTSTVALTPNARFSETNPCNNNVVITNNVLSAIGANPSTPLEQVCIGTTQLQNHCYYHNSQVETQCMAYDALRGSSGVPSAITYDTILMAADFGVSTSCAIACASMNQTAMALCSYAAAAVGAGEIAMLIAQQAGTLNQALNQYTQLTNYTIAEGAIGGVGGATGATGIGLRIEKNTAQPSDSGHEEIRPEETKKTQYQRIASCSSAAVFAILGGVRVAALIELNKAKTNACNAINELFSNPGASSKGLSSAGSSFPGSSSGSAATIVTNGGNLSANTAELQSFANCIQQNPSATTAQCAAQSGMTPTTGSATDANLLSPNTNPAPYLAPLGNTIPFIQKAMNSGAGNALGSILPPNNSNLSSALTNLAQTAQNKPPEVISDLLNLNTSYNAGGASSKNNMGGSSDNPFAALMGGMANGGTPTNADHTILSFASSLVDNDIWHTATQKTLFQIVTQRLYKSLNRKSLN